MQNEINVILITADSLRYDYLGCYGSEPSITPNIDKFSKDAFLFENYFTQGNRTPVCFPSILSGQYAYKYGFDKRLHPDRLLIQEILKENDYFSMAMHSNPYISTEFNYNRGFDRYYENISKFDNPIIPKSFRKGLRKMDIALNGPYSEGKKINSQFFSVLESVKPNKYFAWLHYMDTHGPYIHKNGLKQINIFKGSKLWRKAMSYPELINANEHNRLVDTYKEEIAYFDTCFKHLMNNIDVENTIIVFTADHGELIGEHGIYGHDHNHLEPLFRVPLMISLPEKHFQYHPKNIHHMAQSIDICPTLLDLLNIDTYNYKFNGESLKKYMHDKDTRDDDKIIIHEIRKGYYCVRDSRFKYIYNNRPNQSFEAFFDLKEDPDEKKNCLSKFENTFELERLKQQLSEYFQNINIHDGESYDSLEPSENIKERLKALGYM